MTKRSGRTQPCDRAQARTRLDNAQKSLEVAELAADEQEIPASSACTRPSSAKRRREALTAGCDPVRTSRATSRPVSGRVVPRRTSTTSMSIGERMSAQGRDRSMIR